MFPLNLPNLLTVLRIMLVPVLVVALLGNTSEGDVLAAVVFALASLVSLVSLHRLAAWVAMVIITRELAVAMLRLAATQAGVVMAASMFGKVKTCLQIAAILAVISVHGTPLWVSVLLYVTVLVTVLSGLDYFFGIRRRMAQSERSRARATQPPA